MSELEVAFEIALTRLIRTREEYPILSIDSCKETESKYYDARRRQHVVERNVEVGYTTIHGQNIFQNTFQWPGDFLTLFSELIKE